MANKENNSFQLSKSGVKIYAKDKNKKPPQGWYFGYAESAFETEIKYKKQYPGVGQYDVESQQKSDKIHKKKSSNMPQTKRFIEEPIQSPPATHYFRSQSTKKSRPVKNQSQSSKDILGKQNKCIQKQKEQYNQNHEENEMNLSSQRDIIDEQIEHSYYQNKNSNSNKNRSRNNMKNSPIYRKYSEINLNLSQSTFSMAARNTENLFINNLSVGPAKYNIDTTIGKSFESTAPNFKLYEGKKDITRYSQGGDSPGVGKYSIERADSYLNETKGGAMLKGEKDTFKSLILSQNLNNPGVGTYQSEKISAFGSNTKGVKFPESEKKLLIDQLLYSKRNIPGPGVYNIENEANFRYKNQQGQSIPKYKTQLFSTKIDYEPSPHDYHSEINNYNKAIKISQSTRNLHQKVDDTPGVGTYKVEENFWQKQQKVQERQKSYIQIFFLIYYKEQKQLFFIFFIQISINTQNFSNQLQKVLIQRKEPQIIVDEFGDTRKEKDRAQYIKKKQLLEYGNKKQIDPKILEKYLKKKLPIQEYSKIFQPSSVSYNQDIGIIKDQKFFNVTQNYQGSDMRRDQFLDVYGKPEFQPRSQGPALHGKILPIQDNGQTIPQSQKVSFVPPPRIKPGVGDYKVEVEDGFSHAEKVNNRKQKFMEQNQALQEYLRQREYQNQAKNYQIQAKKEKEKQQEYLKNLKQNV
ncbi:hypothetical protein PPERSA_07083 [Pseudocohnilembus persalinus]|uniref:Uncharacterized protein n=1 Tax=Pseudocohnilembus persalinus TaxID=266149 RepID=A0A0V0QYF9_PSEPJ|nr:hypothetical protein PPERSA_07083 [Pseudocohnilembus persalinus]|eukprot:KRX06920.1 hypothetical protein PPERSA_07083 [Pseudocohnilembus persalinus]